MLQAGRPMAVVPGGSNKNEEVKLDLWDVQKAEPANFHYGYSTYFHATFDPDQQDLMTNRMCVHWGLGEERAT
jgi:hypothetical protein